MICTSNTEKRLQGENKMEQQDNPQQDTIKEENYRLWRLMDHTRFMISRIREKELDEFGLTPEQVHILDILENSDGHTLINEIVAITQRKHHSISTQIDRMDKQGLVRRKRIPNDLRQYQILITKKGKSLLGRLTRDSFERTFSVLTPEAKKEMYKSLNRLLDRAYELHGVPHIKRFPKETQDYEALMRQESETGT